MHTVRFAFVLLLTYLLDSFMLFYKYSNLNSIIFHICILYYICVLSAACSLLLTYVLYSFKLLSISTVILRSNFNTCM